MNNYISNLKKSLAYATISFIASVSFVINGFFPNVLSSTGSEFINNLNEIINHSIKN
jgi:hypothetical protein